MRVPAQLTRSGSTVVRTRVTLAAADALREHARVCGETQGGILRRLIQLALSKGGDKALPTVIKALGLPEDADGQSILDAIHALLAEGAPHAGDALGDTASADLTASERAAVATMTQEQARAFVALRKQRRAERGRKTPTRK